MLIWTSRNIPNVGLFSAYAEVFPTLSTGFATPLTFLCLRRGVSRTGRSSCLNQCFSLPTQRCFLRYKTSGNPGSLFSAYAEVFPGTILVRVASAAFLCLRRGVSICQIERRKTGSFSLPTQRCFCFGPPCGNRGSLFSAYAEVFPSFEVILRSDGAFLCLRRGVSLFLFPQSLEYRLFSAYAEVFLSTCVRVIV